jgi:hypothetical protein
MPRLPGGGGFHFFHLPIHGIGGPDMGMYCALGIAILAVIAIGWSLGYTGGRLSAGKPVFAPQPKASTSAQVDPSIFSPPPDPIFTPEEVADKAARTARLMERLAQTERAFDPTPLRDWIWNFFHEVQRCWQERDSGPVWERMTPAARTAYKSGIADMRSQRMINKLDSLSLLRLHFVRVAHPADIAGHSRHGARHVQGAVAFRPRKHGLVGGRQLGDPHLPGMLDVPP